jgi:ADP-ribose pyrophosphatase YjhB (NUDIX family)
MNKTFVYVGAVVRRGEEILLVRQAEGHSLGGQWTVPWGAVECRESPVAAVIREAWEESGIHAEVDGLLGIQELPAPQEGCVAIVYSCRHISGTPDPKDRETDAAAYYSLSQLDALDEPVELWSEWLIRRVFAGDVVITPADRRNPLQVRGAFV